MYTAETLMVRKIVVNTLIQQLFTYIQIFTYIQKEKTKQFILIYSKKKGKNKVIF